VAATASSSAVGAWRPKVHGLLDCEANVTVVAPPIDDDLHRLPVHRGASLQPF
jgi:siroheme synthase (precorrin-2 oxidase/ferrochelatase)